MKYRIIRRISNDIPPLNGGSTWWSLSRETLAYVIEYTEKKKAFIKRLRHTFCPDEMYFQTVIMNSPHADKVVNDNLRYIDWGDHDQVSPSILGIDDIDKISSSNKLFARKFEFPKSIELKEELNRRMLKPELEV